MSNKNKRQSHKKIEQVNRHCKKNYELYTQSKFTLRQKIL